MIGAPLQGATVPIFKYVKVLFLTSGMGSVLICGIGLMLGVLLIAKWGGPERSAISLSVQQVLRPGPKNAGVADTKKVVQTIPQRSTLRRVVAREASSAPRIERTIFEEPITSEKLAFLNDDAGQPVRDVIREEDVRNIVSQVVPYVPFHFGMEMAMTNIVENVLTHSQTPVEVRDGRYVTMSSRSATGGSWVFLWIDTKAGIGVSGIFFHPNNGEPTPTLTLSSKQVTARSLNMSQLPAGFVEDLNRAIVAEGIPAVTTRYFVNASGEKMVLTHDEDLCKATAQEECAQVKVAAADIDTKAAEFLGQTHYASNATMRMVASSATVDR
jgi:hypothetical protein